MGQAFGTLPPKVRVSLSYLNLNLNTINGNNSSSSVTFCSIGLSGYCEAKGLAKVIPSSR